MKRTLVFATSFGYFHRVTAFAYQGSPYPIREELVAAHQLAWEAIAGPGNWWNGAQRVAIAEEVRQALDCPWCAERKAALSPYAVQGQHPDNDLLPAAAVDAIHRITSDPNRLTKTWFDGLLTEDFTDAHYVEMLGVLVTVVCIDGIHRALGLPLEPLPVPRSGAPSRYRPASAVLSDQAWLPMITAPAARGTADEDLYPGRRTGNVISAMSLVPDAVRLLNATQKVHYVDFVTAGMVRAPNRHLSRPQMEVIAARVSSINDCFY